MKLQPGTKAMITYQDGSVRRFVRGTILKETPLAVTIKLDEDHILKIKRNKILRTLVIAKGIK